MLSMFALSLIIMPWFILKLNFVGSIVLSKPVLDKFNFGRLSIICLQLGKTGPLAIWDLPCLGVTEAHSFLIGCHLGVASFKLEDWRACLSSPEEGDILSYETNQFNTESSQQMTEKAMTRLHRQIVETTLIIIVKQLIQLLSYLSQPYTILRFIFSLLLLISKKLNGHKQYPCVTFICHSRRRLWVR